MHFIIHCLDKPDHLAQRMEYRPAHLKHLEGYAKELMLAGPLLTDDGQNMIGTLIIAEFPSRQEAEAFVANDPYRKGGLFESVTITPWRKTLPKS